MSTRSASSSSSLLDTVRCAAIFLAKEAEPRFVFTKTSTCEPSFTSSSTRSIISRSPFAARNTSSFNGTGLHSERIMDACSQLPNSSAFGIVADRAMTLTRGLKLMNRAIAPSNLGPRFSSPNTCTSSTTTTEICLNQAGFRRVSESSFSNVSITMSYLSRYREELS